VIAASLKGRRGQTAFYPLSTQSSHFGDHVIAASLKEKVALESGERALISAIT